MTSKVTVRELGKFEKIKFNTYIQLKNFNAKLLEKLEEKGFDRTFWKHQISAGSIG